MIRLLFIRLKRALRPAPHKQLAGELAGFTAMVNRFESIAQAAMKHVDDHVSHIQHRERAHSRKVSRLHTKHEQFIANKDAAIQQLDATQKQAARAAGKIRSFLND